MLRATEPESKLAPKIPRYYVSLETQGSFMRQVSGCTLQQVDKFKYLGVVFTSNGRRSSRRL